MVSAAAVTLSCPKLPLTFGSSSSPTTPNNLSRGDDLRQSVHPLESLDDLPERISVHLPQSHVENGRADARLQLGRRSLNEHLPFVDDGDPVGELVNLFQIV